MDRNYQPGDAPWLRARSLQVSELHGETSIQFNEEEASTAGARPWGHLVVALDPAQSVEILDDAGAPIGKSITHAELVAALRSAYIAAAKARDAKER